LKTIIWENRELPGSGSSEKRFQIMWSSYHCGSDKNVVSMPKLVEKNSDKLRKQYLSLVYNLGEEKIEGIKLSEYFKINPEFNFWWTTLIAEKCNFAKSPQINDIIRLIMLKDWCQEKKVSDIHLETNKRQLIVSMKNFCEGEGIAFSHSSSLRKKNSIPSLKYLFSLTPYYIQGLAWLILYIISSWRLKGVGVQDWKKSKAKITFVSYLFNIRRGDFTEGKFNSPFWTNIPQTLKEKHIDSNWLHIHVKDKVLKSSFYAANAINKYNKNETQNHVALTSFLSVHVILAVLKDWKLLKRKLKNVENKLKNRPSFKRFWPLLKTDWDTSIYGYVAPSNIISYHLFRSALEMLPIQRRCIYLQENQGWEFGLIQAWRNCFHKDLIGFPHATVPYWDLRYFFDARIFAKESKSPPLPDKIACNGEDSLMKHKKGGYPAEKLLKVESIRFLYLNHQEKMRKHNIKNGIKKLLVVGDYLEINTKRQLKLLEAAKTFFKCAFTITFKPHPGCGLNFRYYEDLKLKVETKPIGEIIHGYDFVYSSITTSAAVDAYCVGLPVAIYIDGSSLNLSPLRGKRDVYYVTKPEELAESFNFNNQKLNLKKTRKNFFYLDKKLTKWLRVLSYGK